MSSRDYNLQVRDWINTAVDNQPFISFSELVNALPGVHPNDIARELAALDSVTLRQDTPGPAPRPDRHIIKLPVPHPLDFDWRFTPETIKYLFQRIYSLNATPQGLCFLGAPTLFREAHERGLSTPFYLIDASTPSTTALEGTKQANIFLRDLLMDPIPEIHVDIAVADPPWYEEFTLGFLWASAQLVSAGGFVLLSFPPIGTRPLIEEEWNRIHTFAQQLGLTLSDKAVSLKYMSPPFEQNAMRAAKHKHVHTDWRPGVLAIFQKTGECRISRPSPPSHRDEWLEESLLGIRWKLRPQHLTSGSPSLIELTIGDILDSVSRRDPRRTQVDVWTSGNRVYGCQNTMQLALTIRALAAGIRPDTYISDVFGRKLTQVESDIFLLAAKQVTTITSRELREYLLNWEE